MPTITKLADSLDWSDELKKVTVECAGQGFVDFHGILLAGEEKVWKDQLAADLERTDDGEDENDNDDIDDPSLPMVDLFSLSELELQEIDYYQVLHLPCRPTITPDDVKKAYRKACLLYHPDKSGRGEEDAVFLKVKAAFETLSTQKQAYDSTEMPFDDSLPSENPSDFFQEYGPVFERNLHFDARLLPSKQNDSNKKRNKRASSARNNKKPPSLGDENTSIEEVHEFYDYWTHFESWRDFSLQAARELETEDHLENAESRYEKRWYQKEIDRHAKKLKQQEVARITALVERAMAADPRLIQERKRLIEEKERKQREREEEALNKKKREEEARIAEERRVEEEKKRKAEEKLQKEKEKKMFRKCKQAFRRYVSEALKELLEREHALEDEVDLICNELDRLQLTGFNEKLDSKPAPEVVSLVKKQAEDLRSGASQKNGEEVTDEATSKIDNVNEKSAVKAANGSSSTPSSSSSSKVKVPFTKEELSALAKGVKKFPPGGANRWDQIAHYVNNLCRPADPRTKEECIETFNQVNKTVKAQRNGGSTAVPAKTAEAANTETSKPPEENSSGWSSEQDQQLQNGLAKYPATMEKNERWTKIAQEVPGKSKKECVQRFKEIRNAIKAKK